MAAAKAKQQTEQRQEIERMQVLSPYNYEQDGRMRTTWTNVGTAFVKHGGEGFNIEIKPGLAVSGRLVIRPVRQEGGQHVEVDADVDLVG